MLVNLISIPILLDLLGKDAYGIQRLVAVLIGYFTIMDMGLDLPIIKFVSRYKSIGKDDLLQKLLNTTILLYTCIGLIGLVIIFILSKFFALYVFNIPVFLQKDAILVFYIASFGFLASVGMSWGRALFKGLQKYHITYAVSTFNQLVGIVLGITVVLYGHGLVGFVLVRVVTAFVSVLMYYVLAKKSLSITFNPKFDRGILKAIREFVSYGIINRAVGAILSRLDVTIIGITIGVGAVAIYSVPFMIVSQLGYMIAFAIGFVFPLTSELLAKNQVIKTQTLFNHINKITIILTGIVFVPVFIFGDRFLFLWIRDIYEEAAPLLKVLTIYALIGSSTITISNNIILGYGKIKYFTFFNIIKNLSGGIMMYFFIKKYGIMGAPIGLAVAELLGIPYWIYCIKHLLHLSVLPIIFKSLYSMIVIMSVGFVFYFFESNIDSWLSLIIVGIGYLCTILCVSWYLLIDKDMKLQINKALFISA
jgi:O-antigen/teichoic acid export membrane protein